MQKKSIKITLGAVQETLFLPLWGRAKEAEKKDAILRDTFARELVERIDYDFTRIENTQTAMHQFTFAARAYKFDRIIGEFIAGNEDAVVINLGSGLDTSFHRLDNGRVQWINIDLPDVVALRNTLIPDSDRQITLAKSILDFSWMDDVEKYIKERPVIFSAAGLLFYFSPDEVKMLFQKLAEHYPGAHMVFDSMKRVMVWIWNKIALKKNTVNASALLQWHLQKARLLKKWVKTITVIGENPIFAGITPRAEWTKVMRREVFTTNLLRWYNINHVRF